MSAKKWIRDFTILLCGALMIFILLMVAIDPLFHYHAPLPHLNYKLIREDERLINDGIMRSFSYDGAVMGSSMIENTNISYVNDKMSGTFIKCPYFGASLKEMSLNEEQLISRNPETHKIIRCIDYLGIRQDKDLMNYSEDMYPDYLYNDNLVDDVHYVLNKNIFLKYTAPIVLGQATEAESSLDLWGNWMEGFSFGKDAVLATQSYTSFEPTSRDKVITDLDECMLLLTDEEISAVRDNIRQNCCMNAINHPEIDFYYFFSPYSICYWGSLFAQNDVAKQVACEKVAIEEMMDIPNLHLYSFNTDFSLTTNLDNYKDYYHYGEWTNYDLIDSISSNQNELTRDTYEEYLRTELLYYQTYDYSAIFDGEMH